MVDKLYRLSEKYMVKIVKDLQDFRQMESDWNSLAEKQGSYYPWMCWEWYDLWLESFCNDARLLILVVYESSRMVSIAPFLVKEEKFKGLVKVRKIELIGNDHSPVRNFLFGDSSDQAKKEILHSIFNFFCNSYKDWDLIELDTLPVEKNVFDIAECAVEDIGFKHRSCFCTGNWYLDEIDYPSSAYCENQSKRFRKQLLYQLRRINKLGGVKVDIKLEFDALDDDLDIYDKIREKSWKAPEKDREFSREFLKLTAKKGWLRYGFLYCDGVPVAAQRWILWGSTAYILSVSYDGNYGKYSPGSILSSEMFEYMIDREKVTEIDNMRGDESYKENWTPMRRERKNITIFNRNLKGQIIAFLTIKLLPIIRRNQWFASLYGKLA